jgi:hypothetical protein
VTGKLTKAHEFENKTLVSHILMLSQGFNYLSDEKFDLFESLELKSVMRDENEIKLQRLQQFKKGNKHVPSLSYFKLSYKQLCEVKLEGPEKYTPKNVAVHLEKAFSLGENLIEPLAMKILFTRKCKEKGKEEENLYKINQIMLKAKSVFIHLSSIEEENEFFCTRFVKEHPFNSFIPDLLNYCTKSAPSVSKHSF